MSKSLVKTEPETPKEVVVATPNNFGFLGNWNQMMEAAKTLVKSGFLPDNIKTPEQCIAVMMTGNELGLKPMESLKSLYVIKGKVGMASQIMLALVRRSGLLEYIKFGETEDMCTVTVKRINEEPYSYSFTMADARRAGLVTGKPGAGWTNYPNLMLRWRALAGNLRVTFPDILAGMYTFEELGANIDPQSEKVIETPFDEELEYKRLFEGLRNLSDKKRPKQEFDDWFVLNKDEINQLSDAKKSILRNMYVSATGGKVKQDVTTSSVGGEESTPLADVANSESSTDTTKEIGSQKDFFDGDGKLIEGDSQQNNP